MKINTDVAMIRSIDDCDLSGLNTCIVKAKAIAVPDRNRIEFDNCASTDTRGKYPRLSGRDTAVAKGPQWERIWAGGLRSLPRNEELAGKPRRYSCLVSQRLDREAIHQ